MGLKEQITEDMKAAMRAKDMGKLGTIRLLTAAMKQKEVDERVELTDAHVLAIIDKMVKQRKDSISQFEAGGRQDLADVEKAELAVLATYMPASLSDDEIKAEVQAAVAAQAEWLAVPPRERAEIFRRAGNLFQQHFDELARMVARETGGVLFKGSGFYETDYRSDSYKAGEKAAKKDSSSSDSSSSSSD